MNRLHNYKLNVIFSFFNTFLMFILSFISRTIFIYTLGAEYLGLNGLFSNVLGLLSLADLGINSAISYSLYKPIAENDNKKISQLINFFGKVYKVIGIVILIIGLSLIPFLKYIVNFDELIQVNYYLIYFLFLLNSVISYLFFSYKSTLIYAAQKNYLTTKYDMIMNIIQISVQIFILYYYKNYYLYLIIPIIITFIRNYLVSRIANNLYPSILNKTYGSLGQKEKRELFKNIYSLSLLKFSGVIYSSTDNIIISTFINTKVVGYYSNYLMLINVVKQFVNICFSSLIASIGDINAKESKEYKFSIFEEMNIVNYIVYGFCFTCLLNMLNPFITIWLGTKYTFTDITVLLISLTFLVPGYINIVNIFKDACGLFWETRFRTLATAIVNLVSSIILVQFMGLNGTLLGTIFAYLSTIYILDPIIVFKNIFDVNVKCFYISLLKNSLFLCITNIIIKIIVKRILISSFFLLVLEGMLISLIYFVLFFIFYKNNKSLHKILTRLK